MASVSLNPQVDDTPQRMIDQARQAYQAGSQAFATWIQVVLPNLTLGEWQILVINMVGWPKPLTPGQRQALEQGQTYRAIHRQLLFLLLTTHQWDSAQYFGRTLTNSDTTLEFFLSHDDVVDIVLNAGIRLESSDHGKAIRCYEFAFELDPQNLLAALNLLKEAINRKDDFGALAYAQAIFEAVNQGKTCRSNYLYPLLQQLYNTEQFETFFSLADAYTQLRPASERPAYAAVLSQIASYYIPDFCEAYEGLWDPQTFFSGDIAREFVYNLQAYGAVAEGLMKIADVQESGSIVQLQMLCTAAAFYGIGGYFNKMKTNIELILSLWSLDKIDALNEFKNQEKYASSFQLVFRFMYLINYVFDDYHLIRSFQQKAAKVYFEAMLPEYLEVESYEKFCQSKIAQEHNSGSIKTKKLLKVGYLACTFRRHSVAFLSHHTLSYHDPTQVQSYIYSYDSKTRDDITELFERGAFAFRDFSLLKVPEIVKAIRNDDLDILVYQDVLTSQLGCDLIALRLAPVQIGWLGGDSPGLPGMDYFLVDPYLLPLGAEALYSEKLLRIPTFVAVENFAYIPTDRAKFRRALDIPEDAVVYVTAAVGYKRNTDWIDCQLEIIRQVPNGFLIIKGLSDLGHMTQEFQKAAAEKGILDRIRFLALAPTQEAHRGQLVGMDIMLDTFPYTGATHSVEALWQGVLVLSCYGNHYYSRMTYTLLKNIGGLDDCIAGSAEEYVRKGVQLGLDTHLRQKLQHHLQSQRHSSVVWDPYYHARSLEAAYRQIVDGTWVPETIIQPIYRSEETFATATEWNQAGLVYFRQGQQQRDPQSRRTSWETARECWRLGLALEPTHLPCCINQLLILMYLGFPFASWQGAEQLLEELIVLPLDLPGWIAPFALEEHVLWIPSYNQKLTTVRNRYIHLLYRWIGDITIRIYQPEEQEIWRKIREINAEDDDALLRVAINALMLRQFSGQYLLEALIEGQKTNQQTLERASKLLTLCHYDLNQNQRLNLYPKSVTAPELTVSYSGVQLYLEPSLSSIGTLILLSRGEWFEGELGFCEHYLQPGMTVIDVGANIGVYTFAAAALVGFSGRVFAIEPTPGCVDCLRKTVVTNHLENQVEIIVAAAGDTVKEVTFSNTPQSVYNRVEMTKNTEIEEDSLGLNIKLKVVQDRLIVPQITLDSLWIQKGTPEINLVKIDTEGAEFSVLQGSSQLITACHPAIILEIQNGYDEIEKTTIPAQWLVNHGYALYYYLPHLNQLRPLHPDSQKWGSYNAIFNLIALHQNSDSDSLFRADSIES